MLQCDLTCWATAVRNWRAPKMPRLYASGRARSCDRQHRSAEHCVRSWGVNWARWC